MLKRVVCTELRTAESAQTGEFTVCLLLPYEYHSVYL